MLAVGVLLTSGCRGCRDEDPEAAAKRKEEETERRREDEKPDFETRAPVVIPGAYEDEQRFNRTKKGHWVATDLRIIANKFDSQGELFAQAYDQRRLFPLRIPYTNHYLRSVRPASLPKGEWRHLEIPAYMPRASELRNTTIEYGYVNRNTGLRQANAFFGATSMMPHQHHWVVLTSRPDRFRYVSVFDGVLIPDVMYSGERFPPFYQVIYSDPDQAMVPLPRNPLEWTTTAYVWWDDLAADQLDEDQQQALIDWLHFGGQLILNGPASLDKVGNSFLADYLPARFDGTYNLTNDDLAPLNEFWSIEDDKRDGVRHELRIGPESPLLAVKLQPDPRGRPVNNTNGLVWERMVGRGRIVVTAFGLDAGPVAAWPSYSSFINGCLMRRPPRRFGRTINETLSFAWVSDPTSIWDPMLASTLRMTSRDLAAGYGGTYEAPEIPPGLEEDEAEQALQRWNFGQYRPEPYSTGLRLVDETREMKRDLSDTWHYGGFQDDPESGVAGWNDFSGISVAARNTLKDAAGITPPNRQFVLKMLAIYLAVLVPLNWLVFRLMGRVEWAWVAVPVIAVVGAVVVVRTAALDIGFVRSNTQVGLLEIHADYPRAHLSQYSALYTSLSTAYALEMDNATGQAMPLAGDPTTFRPAQQVEPVMFRRTLTSRLEGFQIQSNSTGMLHAEMMLDLQGPFRWNRREDGSFVVENQSAVNVQDAGVLMKTDDGDIRFAWIGALPANTSSDVLNFKSLDASVYPTAALNEWTSRNEMLLSADQRAASIWSRLAKGDVQEVEITRFREVPEIDRNWDAWMRLVSQRYRHIDPRDLEFLALKQDQFREIYEQFHSDPGINVSRLLQVVVRNLNLAPGEVRLIGATEQQLGNTRFEPESTQIEQQTLVLVHLQRPPPGPARPDVNRLADVSDATTSLDWEELQKEMFSDESGDESGDGEDSNDPGGS